MGGKGSGASREQMLKIRAMVKPAQTVKLKCVRCGKEIIKLKNLADKCTNNYCSNICRHNGTKPKNYK